MKETPNQRIGGMPGGAVEKPTPDFPPDASKPPCNNPFHVEDDEMAQRLIISAVGAVLSPDQTVHHVKQRSGSHSEKIRPHLRAFYHQLERHQKVVAGLFLTTQLAQLREKLFGISEKESKEISRIDSELAENKKTNRSNTIKLSAAFVVTTAIMVAAQAPLLPTLGLAAVLFGGVGYLYSLQIQRSNAALESDKQRITQLAEEERKNEVEKAVQKVKASSVEIKENFEKSSPQAWQRFLKEIGKEHAPAIMQLLREQASKGSEQGGMIFFRPHESEFIPLKNIVAEFWDESSRLALEQIKTGNAHGALSAIQDVFDLSIATLSVSPEDMSMGKDNASAVINILDKRLSMVSTSHEKTQVLEHFIRQIDETLIRMWTRTAIILSPQEIWTKATGQPLPPLSQNPLRAIIAENSLMSSLMNELNKSSLFLHTHPYPPKTFKEAEKQMSSDIANSKNKGRLGLMAAPIEGGFTLCFHHGGGIMHVGDFKTAA